MNYIEQIGEIIFVTPPIRNFKKDVKEIYHLLQASGMSYDELEASMRLNWTDNKYLSQDEVQGMEEDFQLYIKEVKNYGN